MQNDLRKYMYANANIANVVMAYTWATQGASVVELAASRQETRRAR
jgi:hypothetical protein